MAQIEFLQLLKGTVSDIINDSTLKSFFSGGVVNLFHQVIPQNGKYPCIVVSCSGDDVLIANRKTAFQNVDISFRIYSVNDGIDTVAGIANALDDVIKNNGFKSEGNVAYYGFVRKMSMLDVQDDKGDMYYSIYLEYLNNAYGI